MQRSEGSLSSVFIRFDMLRFPLILFVIYIHNAATEIKFADGTVGGENASWLQGYVVGFISQGVARIAVPLFYLMAGYLFFLTAEWSMRTYARKVHSRLHTLVIPYLFWNTCLFLVLWIAQRNPATAVFFSSAPFDDDLLSLATIDRILGIASFPVSYQFWFIRDLFLLVLISPGLHFIAVRAGPIAGLVLFFLWVFDPFPAIPLSKEALLFFYLGSFLAISGRGPFLLDRFAGVSIAVSLISFAARPLLAGTLLDRPLLCIGISAGLVAALGISGPLALSDRTRPVLLKLASASFFLFAMHEPTLTIARKLAGRLGPGGEVASMVLYLLLPFVVAVIGVAAYFVLARILPRFTSIITGGRTAVAKTAPVLAVE